MFGVIHNFQTDPSKLVNMLEDYIIYDSSEDLEIKNLISSKFGSKCRLTKNIGHSLGNWLAFIIEYYETLPDSFALLKGNLIPRHADEDFTRQALSTDKYTPIFRDPNLVEIEGVAFLLAPGLLAETNNSWYVNQSTHKYFAELNEFIHFLYILDFNPKFVAFAPGGCYVVEKSQVQRYPKVFWQVLHEIVTYDFFVSEAWMLERLLHFIFTANCKINPIFYQNKTALQIVDTLPDKTDYNLSRNTNSKHLWIRSRRIILRKIASILKRFGYHSYWPV